MRKTDPGVSDCDVGVVARSEIPDQAGDDETVVGDDGQSPSSPFISRRRSKACMGDNVSRPEPV